jgi:hypothetical protein
VSGKTCELRTIPPQRRRARRSVLQGWLSAGLVGILREVLREAGERPASSLWPGWVSAGSRVRGAAARRAAAERELSRVHLCELAFLFREASRLRRSRSNAADSRACREGLAEALEGARADELCLPARWVALATLCVESSLESWPPAEVLARIALEIEPCEEGRTELAHALLAAGEARAASGAIAAAVLGCGSAARARTLLDELARVEERLGRSVRAGALRGFADHLRDVA